MFAPQPVTEYEGVFHGGRHRERGDGLTPFLLSAGSLPLLVAVFVRTVLQNRCDGLDQFYQCARNKQMFPTTSVVCMCFLFYSSFSFKCFYYEPSDESFPFFEPVFRVGYLS